MHARELVHSLKGTCLALEVAQEERALMPQQCLMPLAHNAVFPLCCTPQQDIMAFKAKVSRAEQKEFLLQALMACLNYTPPTFITFPHSLENRNTLLHSNTLLHKAQHRKEPKEHKDCMMHLYEQVLRSITALITCSVYEAHALELL
eukprot:1154573-Pelagomonas_calceolata.AAC.2